MADGPTAWVSLAWPSPRHSRPEKAAPGEVWHLKSPNPRQNVHMGHVGLQAHLGPRCVEALSSNSYAHVDGRIGVGPLQDPWKELREGSRCKRIIAGSEFVKRPPPVAGHTFVLPNRRHFRSARAGDEVTFALVKRTPRHIEHVASQPDDWPQVH